MDIRLIGVDPGETTGICALDIAGTTAPEHDGAFIRWHGQLQSTPGAVLPVVQGLADGYRGPVVLAVERFVVSTRAGRSASAMAGATTRVLIGELVGLHRSGSCVVRVVQRSASDVKPWAVDKRLSAAGLLVKGMRHANDAARHALFAAVKDCGMADPLSKKSRGAQ